MAHSNTILCQIVSLFPRHEFEVLAKMYHVGQKFRSFNRWSQFLAMAIAQISSRKRRKVLSTPTMVVSGTIMRKVKLDV